MNRLNQNLLIIAAGVLTSFLVAILHNMTGMHLFTWMFWFVIPIGAIGIGFIAAIGFYLCALLLNHRPSKSLLLSMLAVAAGTQLLIYYLEYSALILDDGTPLSDIVGFGAYIDVFLKSQSYQVSIHSVSIGESEELGAWGYGAALLQLVGFMIGALVYYLALVSKPFCEKCGKYYKSRGVLDKLFADGEKYDAYIKKLYGNAAFSDGFVNDLIAEQEAVKIFQGAVHIIFTIFECTSCHQELLSQKVKVYSDDWKEVNNLSRKELVPEGLSIKKHFKKPV